MTERAPAARTRIAVFLGAGRFDRTLVELGDLLAAELAAEVSGLFVEDLDLLQATRLPDAREFCRLTHSVRRLESGELERQLGVQARAAEQALAGAAGRVGVPWSFRAVRGTLDALLADALSDIDLLVLDLAGTAFNLAARGLPAYRPSAARRPLAVVFDGSPAAGRALQYGRRIGVARRRPLAVLLSPPAEQSAAPLREQAERILNGTPASFHELEPGSLDDILARTRSLRAHTLMLGFDDRWVTRQSIERLRERLNCPVLMVK